MPLHFLQQPFQGMFPGLRQKKAPCGSRRDIIETASCNPAQIARITNSVQNGNPAIFDKNKEENKEGHPQYY
jgi:hypothetical protein